MKRLFLLIATVIMTVASCNGNVARSSENNNIPSESDMKINITIGDTVLTATMADNATAHDFISLMPLTLTMTDYNRIEKVSSLPRALTTAGSPAGYDPSIGDITFYAPWGNIAIFYGDFGYAGGLIFLGRIDEGIEAFATAGSLVAKFEIIEE
ncbi:MAG: cyclophilin-like fold protein [Candidatus Cloacimonetes bacterium]|nr:cyclophilin-like fold protein [Candidatus Cloacimonadota bacterium]